MSHDKGSGAGGDGRGGGGAGRGTLHLLRPDGGAPPRDAQRPGDRVVLFDELDGPELVAAIFAAERVVVW